MEVNIGGDVALVTGAGRGVGEAVAKRLATDGALVIVNDIDEQPIENTVTDIEEADGEAYGIKSDITEENKVKSMIQEINEESGSVDILVNNAGVSGGQPLFTKPDDTLFEQQLNTHVWGSIYCVKHVIDGMKEENYGKIVNITSIHTKNGVGFTPQYDVAKFGLLGLTKNLALELGRFGIRVNAVAPGHLDTRMTEDFSEKRRKQITDLNPLDRFGEPEEVAEAVSFLASPASDYINGHELRVDGGQVPIDSFKKL